MNADIEWTTISLLSHPPPSSDQQISIPLDPTCCALTSQAETTPPGSNEASLTASSEPASALSPSANPSVGSSSTDASTSASSNPPLLLPPLIPELVVHILQFLPPNHLLRLQLVSHSLRQLIDEDEYLWKSVHSRYFGGPRLRKALMFRFQKEDDEFLFYSWKASCCAAAREWQQLKKNSDKGSGFACFIRRDEEEEEENGEEDEEEVKGEGEEGVKDGEEAVVEGKTEAGKEDEGECGIHALRAGDKMELQVREGKKEEEEEEKREENSEGKTMVAEAANCDAGDKTGNEEHQLTNVGAMSPKRIRNEEGSQGGSGGSRQRRKRARVKPKKQKVEASLKALEQRIAWAAVSGHWRLLLRLFAKVKRRAGHATSRASLAIGQADAVYYAAANGHAPAFDVLLRFLNEKPSLSDLNTAAAKGHCDVMGIILSRFPTLINSDVNGTTAMKDEISPIHSAAAAAKPKAVELLIKHGVDPNRRADPREETPTMRSGDRPLHLAVRGLANFVVKPSRAIKVARLLIRAGADVNATNDRYATALTELAMHTQSGMEQHVQEMATLLLEHGADVSRVTADGSMAQHLAATSGNLEVLQALRSFGADMTMRHSISGSTCLELASAAMTRGRGLRFKRCVDWLKLEMQRSQTQ